MIFAMNIGYSHRKTNEKKLTRNWNNRGHRDRDMHLLYYMSKGYPNVKVNS